MSHNQWANVDRYFTERLAPADPVLDAALAASAAGGLPAIHVAPNQGKFLSLVAQAIGARNVLEVGTLGGYSTIWLARSLSPAGRLVTLELNPRHAEVARANLARAGLADRVEIRIGPALDSLQALAGEAREPFDLVFIDADKPGNAEYFSRALSLSRPGGVIIVDNVVRNGAVIDPARQDANVGGVKRLIELVAAEPRVSATVIQTVGEKGYDGFLLARIADNA